MLKNSATLFFCLCCNVFVVRSQSISSIRINQLGYATKGIKVAVLSSVKPVMATTFSLIDEKNASVYTGSTGNDFGKYGPFNNTYRLDFSSFNRSGKFSIYVDG